MPEENENYITVKEQADLVISHNLRKEGIITTPGEPFETSEKTEFQSLIENGVIKIEIFDKTKHVQPRFFNARFIREIKGKRTNKPYEKSRKVIAALGDEKKTKILT